jgi:hypothetical protein
LLEYPGVKRAWTSAYLAILLLLTVPLHGQDTVESRDSLAGLPGIMLQIVPPAPEIAERGVPAEVIEAAVNLRLKEAGVPVLAADAPEVTPGLQTLYVEVMALLDEYTEQCTWAVRLDLVQAVRMERNPDTRALMASTWSVAGVSNPTKDWRKRMVDDVLYYTDRFIAAYAAANPQVVTP